MVLTSSNHIHAAGLLTISVDQSRLKPNTFYCCSSDETFGIWTCNSDGALNVDVRNTTNFCRGVLAVYGEDVYLAERGEDVVAGTGQEIVVRYSLASFLPSSPLLMFSLEVTALACNGKYLIAGSSDFTVKCHKIGDSQSIDRYELDAIVVDISISPNGEYFTISTADGYVQVRPIEKTGKRPLTKLRVCDHFSHIKSDSSRIQCIWLPMNSHFLVAGKGGVRVINSSNWEQEQLLAESEVAYETFSLLALSQNNLLAAATTQGSLVTWRILTSGRNQNFQLLNIRKKITQELENITSIAWNSHDVLLLAYSKGYVCSLTDAKEPNPRFYKEEVNSAKNSSNGFIQNGLINDQATESHEGANADEEMMGDPMDGERLEEQEDILSDLSLIKSQYGFHSQGMYISEKRSVAPIAAPLQSEMCTTVTGMRPPKQFAIGSTSATEEGRYLAWNTFGVIRSFTSGADTAVDSSTIEVKFHDSTIHSEIIIDNNDSNYVLGDLNAGIIALASKKNSDKESVIYVHHIDAWEPGSRVWKQKMNSDETIELLCVGREFVAVHTSHRFLRIFTPAGSQRFIISLAGQVLTMCGWRHKLAVAQPTGGILVESEEEYEHQISASIYNIDALSSECSPQLEWTVSMALSPFARLNWMQFSTGGNLITMDQDFTIRLYLAARGIWLPVLIGADLLKNENDALWPIALYESPKAEFRYIHCRNCKHPPINKSVAPATAPLVLPVLNPDTERGKFEAQLILNEMQQFVIGQTNANYLTLPEIQRNKELLKHIEDRYTNDLVTLFALVCRMNREGAAVELAHRTNQSNVIQKLCNYAAKTQRPNLSEKVSTIGRERLEAAEREAQRKSRQQGLSTASSGIDLLPSQSRSLPDANEEEFARIAPSNKLPKRKAPPISSFLPPSLALSNSMADNTKEINVRSINVEERNENDVPVFSGEEADSHNMSMGDELNSTLNSSALLSDSMLLDASPLNNPFKRTKRTPVVGRQHRGFAAPPEHDGHIVDFFDTLGGGRSQKK